MRQINEIHGLIEAARGSASKNTAYSYLQTAIGIIMNIEDFPESDGGLIRRLYQEVRDAASDLNISIDIPYS